MEELQWAMRAEWQRAKDAILQAELEGSAQLAQLVEQAKDRATERGQAELAALRTELQGMLEVSQLRCGCRVRCG